MTDLRDREAVKRNAQKEANRTQTPRHLWAYPTFPGKLNSYEYCFDSHPDGLFPSETIHPEKDPLP